MGSENSDPADRGKDINKRGQNIQENRLSESAGQDPNIEFVQEEIKKRPLNRKKMMRRMMMTAIMAAVFGAVACLFFLLLEPIFNRMLYPKETVTGVMMLWLMAATVVSAPIMTSMTCLSELRELEECASTTNL